MGSSWISRGRTRHAAAMLVLVLLGAIFADTVATAATAPKKRGLSLSKVTLTSADSPADGPVFIALRSRIFQKYGLDVTWLDTAQQPGAVAATTALIAGSANFAVDNFATQVAAADAGAAIRVLAAVGIGEDQEICLSQATATGFDVPAFANTPAQAEAQLAALRGSHLNLAVSSLTSSSYYWFAAAAKKYRITIGTNASNGDVYFTPMGSVVNAVSAYLAGRVDGLLSVPPYTVEPNSIEVEFAKVPLLQPIVANYLATSTAMIQKHSDTVQAVVNALVEATNYPKTHPRAAQNDFNQIETQSGFTNPEELEYLYSVNQPFWKNPYPTETEFNDTLAVYNLSLPTPFTIGYLTLVVARFAKAADRLLGLPVPKTVPTG